MRPQIFIRVQGTWNTSWWRTVYNYNAFQLCEHASVAVEDGQIYDHQPAIVASLLPMSFEFTAMLTWTLVVAKWWSLKWPWCQSCILRNQCWEMERVWLVELYRYLMTELSSSWRWHIQPGPDVTSPSGMLSLIATGLPTDKHCWIAQYQSNFKVASYRDWTFLQMPKTYDDMVESNTCADCLVVAS